VITPELNLLFKEEFDSESTDTRYAAGVAELYARVVARVKHSVPERYMQAAEHFIVETKQYHDEHRWEFIPHPNFLRRIQILAGDVRLP
jgi:hypothetical protein